MLRFFDRLRKGLTTKPFPVFLKPVNNKPPSIVETFLRKAPANKPNQTIDDIVQRISNPELSNLKPQPK